MLRVFKRQNVPWFHRFAREVSQCLVLMASFYVMSVSAHVNAMPPQTEVLQVRFHLSWASFMREPVVFSLGRRKYIATKEQLQALRNKPYYIVAEEFDRYLTRGLSYCRVVGYWPNGGEQHLTAARDDTIWSLLNLDIGHSSVEEAEVATLYFVSTGDNTSADPSLARVSCFLSNIIPVGMPELSNEERIIYRIKEVFGDYAEWVSDVERSKK
jgi:hypothetical protein